MFMAKEQIFNFSCLQDGDFQGLQVHKS
jgi:hypothetical protein